MSPAGNLPVVQQPGFISGKELGDLPRRLPLVCIGMRVVWHLHIHVSPRGVLR
jgi:hypothetical protein